MIKLRRLLYEIEEDELKNIDYSKLSGNKRDIFLLDLAGLVRDKIYSNPYMSDPDGDTIIYAKEIGKKYKVPYQDILSVMRPSGKLKGKVWDNMGKIVPWKNVFGGY